MGVSVLIRSMFFVSKGNFFNIYFSGTKFSDIMYQNRGWHFTAFTQALNDSCCDHNWYVGALPMLNWLATSSNVSLLSLFSGPLIFWSLLKCLLTCSHHWPWDFLYFCWQSVLYKGQGQLLTSVLDLTTCPCLLVQVHWNDKPQLKLNWYITKLTDSEGTDLPGESWPLCSLARNCTMTWWRCLCVILHLLCKMILTVQYLK